jgi:coenzyme F420-reducing hydrogenase beta subunit
LQTISLVPQIIPMPMDRRQLSSTMDCRICGATESCCMMTGATSRNPRSPPLVSTRNIRTDCVSSRVPVLICTVGKIRIPLCLQSEQGRQQSLSNMNEHTRKTRKGQSFPGMVTALLQTDPNKSLHRCVSSKRPWY